MDGAGDRLEVVGVEGVRIDHAVPADHVERMIGQGVARQPRAVLDQHRYVFFAVDDIRLARPVQIALAIRGAEAKLAVGIEIARRRHDVAGRLDDQQIRLHVPGRTRCDRSCSAE